ncbi:protein kinase domain-containing protein [Mariniblastus fucicola]|uniref:Serine/threonine-protein kinase PknB n=1 Tax=Mariniblastus fucicola TaxID=980251 RepID=A0A5B9PCF5_9BACT|nr:protein kinase [Mariniblastus fucicola]QEG22206.1 Serine/threonine-protein kinase PknB [Mariniblastus fucicola]
MQTQFDKLADQFETDLKSGNSPSIDAWLNQVPEVSRPQLLLDLISLEIFYRRKSGQTLKVSDYARFGESAVVHAEQLINATETENSGTQLDSGQVRPSRRIGRYKLLQKIGEGGMGAVWMAEQEEPVQRRVAMKLIKSELASKEVIARFEAERQALALMDHQNIAKVLDAGTTENGTPYFVMELVKGIPITDYCDQNKLSVADRLKLFVPVCKAIQHAHQKGILHRDLKPSNVLVTHYDGEAVPKVIDFGMAKAITHNMKLTDKTLFTEFGKVVGTLQYMSPEQAEMNALDVDTRADIYSLGVMLYELLTGSTPVDKQTLSSNAFFQILEIIREKDPPRPSTRLDSASVAVTSKVSQQRQISSGKLRQVLKGDLDWVVMKALEKDRTRRYQTAADFARDISNFLAGDAVIARPPSTLYQMRKFAAKNRGLAASIAAVGAALLIGIVGTSYGLIRANQKTSEAESHQILAEQKTAEAEKERTKAQASEQLALIEKDNARKNETRAVAAEKRASSESQRARDSEAAAKFQLANARFEANRALEARTLLHEIPEEYRDNFEWHFCNRNFLGSDLTCAGHTARVYKVAFSPDGKTFASASQDRTIKLWDVKTGREISTLKGHSGSVGSIAFSPSGKQLASASSDKSVRLWDVETGQETGRLEGHAELVASVVFSPDGESLATASDDKTVKLWDALTFENTQTFVGHARQVGNVVFSPNGTSLVSSGVDGTVRVWDVDSGDEIWAPLRHNSLVISVACSPDGRYIASASFDTVKLWDAVTGREARTLNGHTQYVHQVAFSPDGTRLASAGRDKSIRMWDVETGLETGTFTGHADWVNGVAFSPDGSRIASASFDGTVKLWDVRSGQHVHTIKGHYGRGTEIAFSPDGRKLVSSSEDQSVRLWCARTGRNMSTFQGHVNRVYGIAYSHDGATVASAAGDGTVRLWDSDSAQEIDVLNGNEGAVYGVAFSPDDKLIASAGSDHTVRIWNVKDGSPNQVFKGHERAVYRITFSPDGSLIASSGAKGSIRIWNVESGKQVNLLKGHPQSVNSVAFSPDGKRLASASDDSTIKLWSLSTGEQLAVLKGHSEGVNQVAFNNDGTRLVSASLDKTIKLWDMTTIHEVLTFNGHSQSVNSAIFSPDGSRIASIGADSVIKLWDATLPTESDTPESEVEKGYLEAKANFDPFWHNDEANKAIRSENWFASVFHHALLIHNDPDNALFHDRLHASYQQLTSQLESEGRRPEQYVSGNIKQALQVPRGSKLPAISIQLAQAVNNATWNRVSTSEAFENSPLSDIEILQYRKIVLQHPRDIFFNTLATAEYRMGNFERAIKAALKSIELSPGPPFPGDYAVIAMSQFKLDERESADETRETFIESLNAQEYANDAECKSFAGEVALVFDPKSNIAEQ